MLVEAKIQSASDVITNSSSETYLIKSNIPEDTFIIVWERILTKLGYNLDDDTHYGEVYSEGGSFRVEFPMSNLGEDVLEALEMFFGKDNVKVECD